TPNAHFGGSTGLFSDAVAPVAAALFCNAAPVGSTSSTSRGCGELVWAKPVTAIARTNTKVKAVSTKGRRLNRREPRMGCRMLNFQTQSSGGRLQGFWKNWSEGGLFASWIS